MDEGAAILGEADVYPDGSWLADIPPYIPVHLQPIDKWGMSIRNQRTWIQGMPGEDRRCVGCHENRIGAGSPRLGQNPTIAEQAQAQQFVMPIEERLELPWTIDLATYPEAKPRVVIQDILDRKCVLCHDGGPADPFAGRGYSFAARNPSTGTAQTFDVPYLDLSSREIEVVYDRELKTYPASYVSLFFPATMEMGMGGAERTGEVPPMWAIPNNARESALIRKVNVLAADGTSPWGNDVLHPEDRGVELSAEERQHLIRSIDVGGQYYARQNTGFVPFAADPVGPGRRY
jgi:hypothetical protein